MTRPILAFLAGVFVGAALLAFSVTWQAIHKAEDDWRGREPVQVV